MRRARGFTLIELLVTVVVVTILATVAVPNFQRMMAVNRMAADVNSVLTGLNYARSEAIKRRAEVTFMITQEDESPWVYQVRVGNTVLRELQGRGTELSPSDMTLRFNPLGKPVKPDDESNCPSGCRITLTSTYAGVDDRVLEVSRQGRVGRRGSD